MLGNCRRSIEVVLSGDEIVRACMVLEGIDLFSDMTSQDRFDIAQVLTIVQFNDGEEIIAAGKLAADTDRGMEASAVFVYTCRRLIDLSLLAGMYFISGGAVQLMEDGLHVMTYDKGPQGHFGELDLLGGGGHLQATEAVGDTECFRLSKSAFDNLEIGAILYSK